MHKTRVGFGVVLVATLAVLACAGEATKPRYVPPPDSTAQNDSTKHPG
jgi:hypothetical protein